MDLGIGDDALPVHAHAGLRDLIGTRLVEGFHGNLAHVDLDPDARGHEVAVKLEGVKHAATHGPATDHSEIHLLHSGRRACRESGRETMTFWRPGGCAAWCLIIPADKRGC